MDYIDGYRYKNNFFMTALYVCNFDTFVCLTLILLKIIFFIELFFLKPYLLILQYIMIFMIMKDFE